MYLRIYVNGNTFDRYGVENVLSKEYIEYLKEKPDMPFTLHDPNASFFSDSFKERVIDPLVWFVQKIDENAEVVFLPDELSAQSAVERHFRDQEMV